MPNRRLGFGIERARKLIHQCQSAIHQYTDNPIEVQIAIHTLKQYLTIHQDNQYELPADISDAIIALLPHLNIETKDCYYTTRDEMFVTASNFEEFAHSRHSVRWYSDEPIGKEKLYDAIKLAQTAPSTCNRQSIKVYIIQSLEKKQQVLKLQNGNRGFGHQADKILLITSNMNYWAPQQRTSAYLDGGIFLQNLLYALHYNRICACPLNAHLKSKQTKQLQKIIGFSNAEIPIAFISIGNAPEKIMIAASQRIPTELITKWV